MGVSVGVVPAGHRNTERSGARRAMGAEQYALVRAYGREVDHLVLCEGGGGAQDQEADREQR